MAALDFPPSSESPFIAPNGVVYVWNDDGYWEADTSEVPSSDNTFLKLDASNDPITGNLTITGGLDVTTKVTSASTTDVDSGDTLVTKDYLNQTTSDAVFWEKSGDNLYPKTLTDKVGVGTSNPIGQLDVRGGVFSNNQNVGITLGLPDGQWMTGQFLRSDAGGVPRLAFDVPITGTGSTKEAISVNNLGNVSIGELFTDSSVDIGNFDAPGSSTAGVKAYSGGAIYIRRNNDNPIFRGYGNNSSAINSEITNTGQAFFRDKVGVGTRTPFSKLDVRTDDQYDGINLRLTDGTKVAELAGLNSDNDNGSLSLYENAQKDVLLRAGEGNNWILNGNLGLGTKTPSAKLAVQGNLIAGLNTDYGLIAAPNHLGNNITANIQVNSQGDINPSMSLNHARSNGLGAPCFSFNKAYGNFDNPTAVNNNADIGSLVFNGFDGTDYSRAAQITTTVDGTPATDSVPGSIKFLTTANGESSPTERMRINNSGNVGIGTDNPNAKLEVTTDAIGEGLRVSRGAGTSSNQYIDLSTSSGGNRITCSYNDAGQKNLTFFMRNHDLDTNDAVMHITPDKFVGIGTEAPYGPLTVNSQLISTSNGAAQFTTVVQSAGKRVQIGANATYPVIQAAGTGTSNNLLLNPYAGKVGIGTEIAPVRTLTVNAPGTSTFARRLLILSNLEFKQHQVVILLTL